MYTDDNILKCFRPGNIVRIYGNQKFTAGFDFDALFLILDIDLVNDRLYYNAINITRNYMLVNQFVWLGLAARLELFCLVCSAS